MSDAWKVSPLRYCEDNYKPKSSEIVVCVGWAGSPLPSHPYYKKSWVEPDGIAFEFNSKEDAAKFRMLYNGETRVAEE